MRLLFWVGFWTFLVDQATKYLVVHMLDLRRVGEILSGGDAAITAADAFSREAELFDQVLQGLLLGNDELNIPAVRLLHRYGLEKFHHVRLYLVLISVIKYHVPIL